MSTILIGKRLIPIEQIALFEPFDEASRGRMQSDRNFQTRIVLLNRDSVLAEDAPGAFAEQNGFRSLNEDSIATNPSVPFSVEAFEPTADFKPDKPYRSRLLWRDQTGKIQSKLLLSSPEDVLATVVRGIEGQETSKPAPRSRRARKRTGSLNPA